MLLFYLTKMLGGILESMIDDSFFSKSDFNYADYLRGRIAIYNKNHSL